MAKILKCPRCQQGMDVTSVSPGATVRCPDCGQMARVPTGNTSVRAKSVSAPIPAAPPPPARNAPAARERGTRVRTRETQQRQQAPPKKSNAGLFIGLGIGAVAVIGVIVFFTMKDHGQEAPPSTTAKTPAKESGPVVFKPKLPPSSDKPIVLGEGNKPESKPTVLSRPAESVDTANWAQLMQQLRPAGGFDQLDRPEGVAFQKVKSYGKAAYPKLIAFIDDEDTAIGIAAAAVLNALTGRDTPLPKGINKSRVKSEWEEWLKNPDAAPKPEPKKE
jgi:hypothetical protein